MSSRRSSRPIRFCEASPFILLASIIGALELLFGDVAVIALELLLGAQLDAEIADLALAALAVLAGAIFAAVDRALGPSEDVLAHAAVELILGAGALRHCRSPIRVVSICPEPHRLLA